MNLNVRTSFTLFKCEPEPLFGSEMEMKRPRILLAGVSVSLLSAYHKLLYEEFEIVGTSADGRALMATAIQLQPDVIVVDLALSSLTDASARLELKKFIPQTKFLVITRKLNLDAALEALHEWASGVLLKRTARKELVYALQRLMADEVYVPSALVQGFEDRKNSSSPAHRSKPLTRRQREVLQLLAEGRTMRATADILSVSTSTIAFHKYKIMRTFGLRSNVELIRFAIREKLTSAE